MRCLINSFTHIAVCYSNMALAVLQVQRWGLGSRHSSTIARFNGTYLKFFLNASGVWLVCFLKKRTKYDTSLKPIAAAISFTCNGVASR